MADSEAEKGKLRKKLDEAGLEQRDGQTQHKQHNRASPRNWPTWKKAYTVFLVSFWEFWMTAVSSAGTAASTQARMESYGISRVVGYFAFTSIYLLGQAIGSVIFSPLSEAFGRKYFYFAGGLAFCVFNIIIAAVDSWIAVFFGRFITGAASAIPATVAFGTFDDILDAHSRIWVVYVYTLSGIGGLVLGPIYSAYVSFYAGWRWVFWISAIVSGVGTVASIFMHESRAASLVKQSLKKIDRQLPNGYDQFSGGVPGEQSDENSSGQSSGQPGEQPGEEKPDEKKNKVWQTLDEALLKPLKYLVTEPIVAMCAALMAISYSLIYGLTEGLTVVYSDFGFQEETTASLPFLALLVGCFLNALPRVWDDLKLKRFKKQNQKILPETKIDSLWTSCFSLAVGLWIFAWTVPPDAHVHWIGSAIGLVLVGYATNDFSYILLGYITDAYGENAASACSAVSLARTVVAAVYPLFTYQMYTGLGGNLATTVWACIATVFCITPFLFSVYGKSLRRSSRHATKDDDRN